MHRSPIQRNTGNAKAIAIAAVAGNFAIAGLNYPGPYRSIGASTAVFAGLGLLTGRAIQL